MMRGLSSSCAKRRMRAFGVTILMAVCSPVLPMAAKAQGSDPFQSVFPPQPAPPRPRPVQPRPSQSPPQSRPSQVLAPDPGPAMAREPELALLPAGNFVMGDPNGFPSEKPVHTVTISRPFYMSTTLVTRGEYSQCVKARKCAAAEVLPFAQTDNDPVAGVSWDNAQTYVAWLRQMTGKPYRLPSEAFWHAQAGAVNEVCGHACTKNSAKWGPARPQTWFTAPALGSYLVCSSQPHRPNTAAPFCRGRAL